MDTELNLKNEKKFRFRKVVQYSFIACILLIQIVIAGYFYNEFSNRKSLDLVQNQLKQIDYLEKLTGKAKYQLSEAQNNLQKYLSTNDKTFLDAYFSSLHNLNGKLEDIQLFNDKHPQFKSKAISVDKFDLKNLKSFIDSTQELSSTSSVKKEELLPSLKAYKPNYNFDKLEVETKTFSDSTKKKGLFGRLKDAVSGDQATKKDSTVVIMKIGNKQVNLQNEMDSVVKTITHHYTKEIQQIKTKANDNKKNTAANVALNEKFYAAFNNLFQYSNSLMMHYETVTNKAKTDLEKQNSKLNSKSNKIREYLVTSLLAIMFVVSLLIFYFTRIAFVYESKLKSANTEINENLKFKSRILGMLSHEIRSPLKIISIFINRINIKTEDPTTKEYLKSILFTNNSLLLQANQILEYTKNQQMKYKLNPVVFNLNDEISAILTAVQPYIESRNNSLSVDKNIAENLIVKSDNTKIHQVFMNILANANKFTENGNIAVHTFVENMDNKTVILKTEIIDNGTGISEKDLKKIFEPYYQGVLSDEMDNLGAGLGLSLCKEIVGLFHGDIFVSNNENKGTKVSFSLQLEKII